MNCLGFYMIIALILRVLKFDQRNLHSTVSPTWSANFPPIAAHPSRYLYVCCYSLLCQQGAGKKSKVIGKNYANIDRSTSIILSICKY